MLDLHDVGYHWPASPERPVLRKLSFHIAHGEKVVLLGPNGGGKSTLLKLLNSLVFASQGRIDWHGQPLTEQRLRQRDTAREFRAGCALLFQHPEAMLFNPTVADEIAYTPRQLGYADVDRRVAHWAAALGLESVLEVAPFDLSGGQKQKVALASVLALEPQLLLLDEPSASLDPATVGWLIDTLIDSEQTLIVATHNLSLAAELGRRALVLGPSGQLLFDGPIEHALADVDLLTAARLAHRHRHAHGVARHSHAHAHDWEAP
jgi:cobalt/nickel transport system ATP-binding protein